MTAAKGTQPMIGSRWTTEIFTYFSTCAESPTTIPAPLPGTLLPCTDNVNNRTQHSTPCKTWVALTAYEIAAAATGGNCKVATL